METVWTASIPKRVEDIDISLDGSRIIVAGSDMLGSVVFLDAADNKKQPEILPQAEGVTSVAFFGKGFVCGGDDGSVSLWKTVKMGSPTRKSIEHDDLVSSIAVSNGLLLSASYDKTIKLWTDAPHSQTTFNGHLNAVQHVRWVPKSDNEFVSCSTDGSSKLWDVRTARETQSLSSSEALYSCDISTHSSPLLALCGAGSFVRVYDLRKTDEVLFNHAVTSSRPNRVVRFSVDGESLAVGNDNGRLTIYHHNKVWEEKNQYHHQNSIRSIIWDPTRKGRLYTGSWDKNVSCHLIH
ncbi:WD domain protein [Planoprotostelium fungivorum]|uniref:Peroxin-7 n=1 Tax=Planoprotostelium fungivorum TaxID=1890364 RepID=A0A2P6NLR9_9EUKA|nr:WD domain protein [Planoprotostelium fungivorum]